MTRPCRPGTALTLIAACGSLLCTNATARAERPEAVTLELTEAMQTALRDNPTLGAARTRIQQAQARLGQARAAYWPRIGAALSYTQIDPAEMTAPGAFQPLTRTDAYNAGLDAEWVLFDGLSRRFKASAAQFGSAASHRAELEARRQLLAAVGNAYFAAQLARENITIAEADQAFNTRLLDEARQRRRAGTGSVSDVLNFEIRVSRAKAALVRARGRLEVNRSVLASLIAIEDSRLPQDRHLAPLQPETDTEMQPVDATAQLAAARKLRPDLLAAADEVERTTASVGAARGSFLPRINLVASVEGYRQDDANFRSEDFGSRVGGVIRYDFLEGGLRRAQVGEAKAIMREAEFMQERLALDVASDVHQAVTDLAQSQEELRLQRQTVELVRRNRDLVEKEYRAGNLSLVRLNEAQRDYVQAEGRRSLAHIALRVAWINLDAATGRIVARFAPVDAMPQE